MKVSFALVVGYRSWPGYFDLVAAKFPYSSPLFEDVREKARIETVSIEEFAEHVVPDRGPEVMDASFAIETGNSWFKLQGLAGDYLGSWDMRLVGASLSMHTEDGAAITMEELLDIGSRAWEEASSKARGV